jgi:hypothetical protein
LDPDSARKRKFAGLRNVVKTYYTCNQKGHLCVRGIKRIKAENKKKKKKKKNRE